MTVFEPVDASSTYEETVARLGTAIRIGILPPGSKLPPERELAEQLHISRSTLRQALATLTERGHLNALRGRLGGTFVAAEPPLASGRRVAPEDRRTLLDRRHVVELGIVHLAAERATDDDRAAMEEANQGLERHVDSDYTSYRRADIAFHIALAEATGSRFLIATMTRLQGDLCDLLDGVGYPDSARRAANEGHRLVFEAVAAGDPLRAVAEMRSHLAGTERLVAEAGAGVS